jgi:hypothetical protein
MSPYLGPPTPLEFAGHPRLGCAGDNPCLERRRELSYRPRPPAGVLRCLWRYRPQIMRIESLSSNLRGSCFHGELCVLLLLFAFSLPCRHLSARRRFAPVGGFRRFRGGPLPDPYTSLNRPLGTLFPCRILTIEGGSRGAIGITHGLSGVPVFVVLFAEPALRFHGTNSCFAGINPQLRCFTMWTCQEQVFNPAAINPGHTLWRRWNGGGRRPHARPNRVQPDLRRAGARSSDVYGRRSGASRCRACSLCDSCTPCVSSPTP